MITHLLVPTDGSKLSDKAVKQAVELAKALKAKITLFHATPDMPAPMYAEGVAVPLVSRREYTKDAEKSARHLLERVATKARASGVTIATLHAVSSTPWEAILAAAKKAKCDAIVMASHGRSGIAGFLLGSETTKVLTHSKLPVLVVR